jgi:hypothetical protein
VLTGIPPYTQPPNQMFITNNNDLTLELPSDIHEWTDHRVLSPILTEEVKINENKMLKGIILYASPFSTCVLHALPISSSLTLSF